MSRDRRGHARDLSSASLRISTSSVLRPSWRSSSRDTVLHLSDGRVAGYLVVARHRHASSLQHQPAPTIEEVRRHAIAPRNDRDAELNNKAADPGLDPASTCGRRARQKDPAASRPTCDAGQIQRKRRTRTWQRRAVVRGVDCGAARIRPGGRRQRSCGGSVDDAVDAPALLLVGGDGEAEPLLRGPAMAPRTVCTCQSVAATNFVDRDALAQHGDMASCSAPSSSCCCPIAARSPPQVAGRPSCPIPRDCKAVY